MSKVIIFERDNGGIVLLAPNYAWMQENNVSLADVAKKDVPPGKKYLIIDESDVPEDHTFYDAWEADFTGVADAGADYGTGSANEVVAWDNGKPVLGGSQ